MRRYLHIGLMSLAFIVTPNAWALTDIQKLEETLMTQGESPELILALSKAYLHSGDPITAKLYLDYLKTLHKNSATNDFTFSDALIAEIKQLENVLDSVSPEVSSSLPSQTLLLLGTGYESNANHGTALDALSFSLDSGQTFVLDVNRQSQAVGSGYLSGLLIHNILIPKYELLASFAVEKTKYLNNMAPDNWMLRAGLSWKQQNLFVYHYENDLSINGILYSGKHQNLRWVYRHQNDRNIYQVGLSKPFKTDNLTHVLGANIAYDISNEHRSGDATKRLDISYSVSGHRYKFDYNFEYGIDDEPYNSVFYPGVRDSYYWHSLSAHYDIGRVQEFNSSIKLQYDSKKSEVELNSWSGASINLLLSRVF